MRVGEADDSTPVDVCRRLAQKSQGRKARIEHGDASDSTAFSTSNHAGVLPV
jgi:hypothetical protein